MGGAQAARRPTRDASSASKAGGKQGRRLAQRPGRARKLCASVSRKQKQGTRVFFFTNAGIIQHRLQQRSGGNYRRREYRHDGGQTGDEKAGRRIWLTG